MMAETKSWDFGDLEGYTRQGEPSQAVRADNWQVAIGLQAVDGLKPSAYLLETAKEHIEGRIGIDEAQRRIRSYYEERGGREESGDSEEADTVSSRIAEILGERTFSFSPVQLQIIHRRLFDQLLLHAGKYRTYNITKREWVLKGDTVYYSSCDSVADTLKYDFDQERDFSYAGLSNKDIVRHTAKFVSGIWQIHPFGEGNTRTTAVFTIQYLRSMGYEVNNEPFKKHSWYFRNALVRANYEDVKQDVSPTTLFLERFFENLLFGAHHDLKNRYLHLDWDKRQATTPERAQEPANSAKELTDATQETSKETSKEMRERILVILREQPASTAVSVAEQVGLSPQGVRYHLDVLKRAGRIRHEGPTKRGWWVIDEQD